MSRLTICLKCHKLKSCSPCRDCDPTGNKLHNTARTTRIKRGFVESVDRNEVYRRDGGICGLCSAHVPRDRFEVDHILPLAEGGEHSYGNVQVACAACNNRKGALAP